MSSSPNMICRIRSIQPHDVMRRSARAMVWYSDFGQMFLGKLDPKTGKVDAISRCPSSKKGFPVGSLDLEIDKDGQCLARRHVPGRASSSSTPRPRSSRPGRSPRSGIERRPVRPSGGDGTADVDGKVWIKNSDGTNHLSARSRHRQVRESRARRRIRRPARRSAPTACIPTRRTTSICSISADTTSARSTPRRSSSPSTRRRRPNSHPRRGRVDAQGRLWFAEYRGNAHRHARSQDAARSRSGRCRRPGASPYDAVAGKKATPGPARC